MSRRSQNDYPELADDYTALFEAPNQTGSPERRLLLAILERAILDYVGNSQREVEEAEEWLFAHEELDEPNQLRLVARDGLNVQGDDLCEEFSLAWICQALDLDVGKVAGTIKRMPKRGNQRIAPWYFQKKDAPRRKEIEQDLVLAEVG